MSDKVIKLPNPNAGISPADPMWMAGYRAAMDDNNLKAQLVEAIKLLKDLRYDVSSLSEDIVEIDQRVKRALKKRR